MTSATDTMDASTFVQTNLYHEDDLSCFTGDATLRASNVSQTRKKAVSETGLNREWSPKKWETSEIAPLSSSFSCHC